MGQQPNIELDLSDLPRPAAHTAPARAWRPNRPGDSRSPADVPSGGAFGTTGPDSGYAGRLTRGRELLIASGETRHNAEAAVAELAGARAARFGRAPTGEDVDVAALLLGYDPEGVDPDLIEALAVDRRGLVAGVAHSARRRLALIAVVDAAVLASGTSEIRARMAGGEKLLDS
jgi:hypothetical protein